MENTFSVFPGELEIRETEAAGVVHSPAAFPYSSGPGHGMATVSDRGMTREHEQRRAGNVRKERIEGNAFRMAA